MTQAEMEELMVTKRRAEGTPCTREHFLQWQQKFDDEMKIFSETQEQQSKENSTGDSKRTKALAAASDEGHKAGRLTGYEFFSDKTNNYDAVEAAAERAETDAAYVDKDEEDANNDVDEALFDDDVDLDDLSFDDDDDEEEDDDDDDVNI